MGTIFRLSLHQLAKPRRILLILFLAALPVALAAAISAFTGGSETNKSEIISGLLDAMLIAVIMPIVTMAQATAAFGNERQDRTLSYLVLKPVRRSRIVLPKLLASIVVCGPLLIISGAVTVLLGLGGNGQAMLAVSVAVFAGVVAYATIFTWMGLITTARAIGFGLLYVFLWEALLSSFLGGVRYLSVRSYSLAILYGLDKKSFEMLGQSAIELPAGIAGAAAVTIVFFLLTVRRLRRMDVP